MRPQKLPHSIYQLMLFQGINGVKVNTWWQLTAADDCLRLISNAPFNKTEIPIPYDHLTVLRRWRKHIYAGKNGGVTRALVGGAVGGDVGAIAGAASARNRMSDQICICVYRDGVEKFNELFENDALDPTKEAKIYFRWDTWQMGAFGDKTFFKELVKKCPLMSSYGIEEWLDFQPL